MALFASTATVLATLAFAREGSRKKPLPSKTISKEAARDLAWKAYVKLSNLKIFAEESVAIVGKHTLDFGVPKFAKKGDQVWEARATKWASLRGILWVHASSGQVKGIIGHWRTHKKRARSHSRKGSSEGESPVQVVERWLSYFRDGEVEKYADEGLLLSEIEKMGSTRGQMIERCRTNKEFFVAILSAMKGTRNVTILDDGKKRVAAFYFQKTTRGYYAATLRWRDGRWIVGQMYKPGQPVTSHGP